MAYAFELIETTCPSFWEANVEGEDAPFSASWITKLSPAFVRAVNLEALM